MYQATITWADGTTATITGRNFLDVAARVGSMTEGTAPVSYRIDEVQEDKENVCTAEH